MSSITEGESIFERFCAYNAVPCRRVPTSSCPTPDYEIDTGAGIVFVEIKQIDSSHGFDAEFKTRTVGSHVRAKIGEARRQAQTTAGSGSPFVLLIFNNLDPMQMYGTEAHDFLAAMHGDLTVQFNQRTDHSNTFHGRNAKLGQEKNTSFSAIGHLFVRRGNPSIELYTNPHAKHPLPAMPASMVVTRIEID